MTIYIFFFKKKINNEKCLAIKMAQKLLHGPNHDKISYQNFWFRHEIKRVVSGVYKKNDKSSTFLLLGDKKKKRFNILTVEKMYIIIRFTWLKD